MLEAGAGDRAFERRWVGTRGSIAAAVLVLFVFAPPAFAQELSIELTRPRPKPTQRLQDPGVAEQSVEQALGERLASERRERVAERWLEIDRRRGLNADIVRVSQVQALRRALRR
jgi:hypothetical protein